LTQHAARIVQLGGESSGDIPGEKVRIEADRFTPIDATLIPTGEIEPVAGTPLEFRKLTHIGARIDADDQQLKRAGGYDHNFVLNGAAGDLPRGGVRDGSEEWPHHEGADHAAWRSVLLGEFSEWSEPGMQRQTLRKARGILPGDAAFSGLSESAEVSEYGCDAGKTVQIDDGVFGVDVGT